MSYVSHVIKKELILEGMDCAGCTSKIEVAIAKLVGVKEVSLNFVTKTLTIEIDDESKMESVVSAAKDIVNQFEPHVIVKEKMIDKVSKKALVLKGLSCVSCATKIEDKVKELKGVHSVYMDFTSEKLVIEAKTHDWHRITKEVTAIVKHIESDVEVIDESRKKDEQGHSHGGGDNKMELIRLGIGAILYAIALAFQMSDSIEFVLYFISYLLIGGEVLLKAGRNIRRGQIFDENFLMSIATIGAFAIGEFPEGVAVMLFYQIGEFFQGLAVNRSRKSIGALMDIRPDYANLKVGNDVKKVSPEEVTVGDHILVKPGEKVPLDGVVIEGQSMVDTSALTGESVPREVEVDSNVLGGFINKNGVLTIKVSKEFGESTVSKILELVENASSKKAPTENFITKFARYYTPVVVFVALALAIIPPLVIDGATFSEWIYRALVFLVISCPCALVISIPLGFFGGIGGASKNGILIKGGNYLEALNSVDIVVFDKTGTLTKGVFKVMEINVEQNISKEELLEYAAYAESYSNHPISTSILKAYGKEVNKEEIESYNEISGHGIKIKVKDKEILAGNIKLMDSEKIAYEPVEAIGTIVYVAINGKLAGSIIISDEIKEDSQRAIKELKAIGVKKIVMLTGDNKQVGIKVAKQLGIDEVHTELLPDEKVEKLEQLDRQKSPKGKLVFVGDGINDAPVLARADIGVAMGGLGSDAAIEAADVVLMTDEPMKLVSAIKIAKRTKRIVWQNIIFAFGVKGIVLLLGAGGLATMWEAVFADVGVALIAVFNAMRVLNVKNL
ncbi:heavy metal translocating P-type ATPase [Alkaliphilus metalliredigens QYMF]|uniref:Heavy metal translocating P-type ATPase n=1 Tax=Alkaliphilus metalliredigens (strain QYMF) TaxID=293826 RepID=A6TJK1_ALKMQ|nr:heavy metal translocating P-type ATPase [Alkaliphilus metalliredigens]ABR46369.1 heavy metal translocating P-type ATPase [Alkaliphilus metalliredigens QYMF]